MCVCVPSQTWGSSARARVRYSKWTKLIIVKNLTPPFTLPTPYPDNPLGSAGLIPAHFPIHIPCFLCVCVYIYKCKMHTYIHIRYTPPHNARVRHGRNHLPAIYLMSPPLLFPLRASYPYHSGFSSTYKMKKYSQIYSGHDDIILHNVMPCPLQRSHVKFT